MHDFILDRYGKGQTLRLGEMPDPTPGPDDVLVEIHAAGLNLLDANIYDGAFEPILPYRFPLVLGHDVVGVVTGLGTNVRRFRLGDEADVALKPVNLSMVEAASMPLVALTAWQALVERAAVGKGHKVLVHAGSGGVGIVAIQLAKHLGATVATTTNAANTAMVERFGADAVIDYKSRKFETVLAGYDVVLNSLDGDTLRNSLAVLKPNGRLISISGPPDPDFARAQGLNFLIRAVLGAMSMDIRWRARRRGVEYLFLLMRADGARLAEIAALIAAGAIRPVVDRVFPSPALNDAIAQLETRRAKGEVVVEMR